MMNDKEMETGSSRSLCFSLLNANSIQAIIILMALMRHCNSFRLKLIFFSSHALLSCYISPTVRFSCPDTHTDALVRQSLFQLFSCYDWTSAETIHIHTL